MGKIYKNITVEELIKCNKNSEKLQLNRLLDVEQMVKDGYWKDEMDLAYRVGLIFHHKNMWGTINPRVVIANIKGEYVIFDMTYDDYNALFEKKYD